MFLSDLIQREHNRLLFGGDEYEQKFGILRSPDGVKLSVILQKTLPNGKPHRRANHFELDGETKARYGHILAVMDVQTDE